MSKGLIEGKRLGATGDAARASLPMRLRESLFLWIANSLPRSQTSDTIRWRVLRIAGMRIDGPCTIWTLSRSGFSHLVDDDPRAAFRLAEAVASELVTLMRASLDNLVELEID